MEHPSHQNEEDLLFKGKEIHCRNEQLFKRCGDSFVYSGYFKKAEDSKEEIAVRKIKVIDCDDQWEHFREKNPIKHKNVLKIISYEEMDEWRFFALERYDATLEQFCRGFYKGPMPSDAQVLCQIAKGLLYLHAKPCSHGNLTPRTILITSSLPMRIKLSEFGLKKFSDQCDEEFGKEQELCQRKYWRLLDGTTTNSNQQTPTPNQDTFAAGCLCFYFLKRGVHPFGDDSSSILENIKQRNPINLKTMTQQEKGVWEFAYEPIKNMIGDPPTDGKSWLLIAKDRFMKALSLKVDETKENTLGEGTFGIVYKGTFDGNPVAVKVFKEHSNDNRKKEQKREMEEHLRLDHENVLKLLRVDELHDETCLVLELCAGTLQDYCDKKYKGPMPSDGIVLYQIANGLHYIHSRDLVHRDIKPANILISKTTPVQMKLSDFGFVKKKNHQGIISRSEVKGTRNYMAPEILRLVGKSSREEPKQTSDTFAAGCVFFFFLTGGRHPYDEPTIIYNNNAPLEHLVEPIIRNILNNKPIALDIELNKSDDRALYQLIGNMIKPLSEVTGEDRISLPETIEQLTAKLDASRKFKKSDWPMSERGSFFCRFHPTEPVLAYGVYDQVILLSADNSSIPFSNWREKLPRPLETGISGRYERIEWNADGTQLAAVSLEGDVIVWSYPGGKILFQLKLNGALMNRIEWNPFRPNVFATFHFMSKKVFFFNFCPDDEWSFHFHTMESGKGIRSVKWISENRVALGLVDEGIEIWEIDKSMTSAQIVKRFKHEGVKGSIRDMAWYERTKCLAVCFDDGWMAIWSMDSDQPIHATKVNGGCESLAWRQNGKSTDDEGVDAARKSADNFILACGFGKGKIVIWTPLDSKEKTRILSQHSVTCSHICYVRSLSFSPDGRFLASEDHHGKLIIWATENWKPLYIGKGEIRWGNRFSWMSSSTDVPDYKLTCDSDDGKVRVIEYTVSQSEKTSEDVNDEMNEDRQGITKTRGEFSIGSSGDLK